jgi:hypothetical protein
LALCLAVCSFIFPVQELRGQCEDPPPAEELVDDGKGGKKQKKTAKKTKKQQQGKAAAEAEVEDEVEEDPEEEGASEREAAKAAKKAEARAKAIAAEGQTLSLVKKGLALQDVSVIAQLLETNGSFTALDFRENFLCKLSRRLLGEALVRSTVSKLQYICLDQWFVVPGLKELNLAGQGIGPEDLLLLGGLLRTNASVVKLDLSDNTCCGIVPNTASVAGHTLVGLRALMEGLKYNAVLQELNLSGNSLYGPGCLLVAELVKARSGADAAASARAQRLQGKQKGGGPALTVPPGDTLTALDLSNNMLSRGTDGGDWYNGVLLLFDCMKALKNLMYFNVRYEPRTLTPSSRSCFLMMTHSRFPPC